MTPKIAIDINECVTAFVIVPSFAPTGATTEIAASDKPSARDHLTLRTMTEVPERGRALALHVRLPAALFRCAGRE